MRTYIHLVRHGESLSNLNPLFEGENILSEKGGMQAQSVADRFKREKIDIIYHSGILRAQKTAEGIAQVTQTRLEVYLFLKERTCIFNSESDIIYTESFDDLKTRLAETKTFLEQCTDRHIVVVSHAIFLKSFAAYLMLGDECTEQSLEKAVDVLVMENTGVSKLIFNSEKKKWRILSWNDVSHMVE